jgi:hypothetical protein
LGFSFLELQSSSSGEDEYGEESGNGDKHMKGFVERPVVFCYESIIELSCSSIVAAAIRHPSHRGVAFSPSSSSCSTSMHFVAKVYQIVG